MNKFLAIFTFLFVTTTQGQPFPRPIPRPIPPIQLADVSFYAITANGPIVKVTDMNGTAIYPFPGQFGKAHIALNPVNKNLYVQPAGGVLHSQALLSPTGWNVGPSEFAGSTGLAFDKEGNAYSANCTQGIIFQYNFLNKTKTALAGLNCPENIKVDRHGKIYVTGPNSLYIMDNISGAGLRKIDGLPGYSFAGGYISGLAVDNKGRVYLMNNGHSRAVRINDLNTLSFDNIAQVGNAPRDIAVDKFNRIYITYSQTNAIIRLDDVAGNGYKRLFLPDSVEGQTTTAVWRLLPLENVDNSRPY